MRLYSFRNVGNAAVLIHTMRSSLAYPLLLVLGSSAQTGFTQLGGGIVSLKAGRKENQAK